MAQMSDVAGYIYGQMTNNSVSNTVNLIKSFLDQTDEASAIPGYSLSALMLWYNQVKSGSPWDHKPIITKQFGEWAYDNETSVAFRFDIWSNIHYGFVGMAAGFDGWILKSGAGAAQVLDDSTDPDTVSRISNSSAATFLVAFDDPRDQAAIDIGVNLWNSSGTNVTLTQLIDVCRSRSDELDTTPAVA